MGTLNVKKQMKSNERFIPLSTNWLRASGILEPEKIDIIEHKAKRKYILGGKNSGKTLPATIDTIMFHENNILGSSFAGRKHAQSATEKMGGYFSRALRLLEANGYETRYPYEKKRNRYYSLKNKKNMVFNSYQQYFSMEDISSTDGSAPENLGFYGIINVDEPIHKEDVNNPDKIPSQEQWDSDIEQLRSNVKRFNKSFLKNNKIKSSKVIETKEWYTMNDWGKHPLSKYIHEIFPQDTFIKEITGYHIEELLGNDELIKTLMKSRNEDDPDDILSSEWAEMWLNTHTKWVYNEKPELDLDDLIVRMTKFANPEEREPADAEVSLRKIAKGFIKQNWSLLAHYAGLQYTPRPDTELLVYNITNFNETTLEKLIKEGYEPIKLSYGVDLDTSRVNTITPAYELVKYTKGFGGKFKKHRIVLIDKQIELAALGSGEFGEMHEISARQIAMMIKKNIIKALKNKVVDANLEKTYLVVDDNRKHYLKMLKDELEPSGLIMNFQTAIKQGHYEIVDRQDYYEESFKRGILHVHEKNGALIEDFKDCVKPSKNAVVRTTAGNTNYLDRIDSSEYAVYPLLSALAKGKKASKYKFERQFQK